MRNYFKHLVWMSAIAVALCAALFSVTGIATLFSAKFWAVAAMATALEVGKLVMASYLYRWWKKTGWWLKSYAVVAVLVLMVITSLGIYGYLSAAYAQVAATPQNTLNQISFTDTRQASLNSTIERLQLDNANIDSRQAQAQASLDNILAGGTELSQRSAFMNLRQEIADLDAERQSNNTRIETAIAERDSLESVKVNLNAELNTNSDIGPFIYVARVTGLPLDTVVKWFVLVIVFVFDPLAISLILAYNNIIVKEREALGLDREGIGPRTVKVSPKEYEKIVELTENPPEPTEALKDLMKMDFDITEPDDLIDLDLGPEDGWEPINTKKEEPDVLDFDAVRNLKSFENFLDLSPEIEFEDEWEDEEPDIPFDQWVRADDLMTKFHPSDDGEHVPLMPGMTARHVERTPDQIPYYMRPGYNWEKRRKEWERDSQAVKYYKEHIERS